MAKYFSTPSKTFHTQFGEEQNCHAKGEKSSMERLLTEVSGAPPLEDSL
jgi:gamma-aminobutyric acid type B receptor-like